MKSISDLENANRVEIFRHLAVDELTEEIELSILGIIAAKHYQDFTRFCDEVYTKKDQIRDISCAIENDTLGFSISYKDKR